jgi:methyltransferase (TIGR00027 family)
MRNQGPSRTAEYMALFRAIESSEPPAHRLFSDPYAVDLLSGALRMLAILARQPGIGRAAARFLDIGWPGARSSGVVRTRLIDDFVCQSFREGIDQFVLLGAGFDSRAHRLPDMQEMRVFEVDHPATQKVKRERLDTVLGLSSSGHIHYVPMNFETDSLEHELLNAGYDKGQRAVVVWEGVVSYLSSDAVNEVFCTLARLLAQGSRVIFTYVDKRAITGDVRFAKAQRTNTWVRLRGEPFIFGFDPPELNDYLKSRGFELRSDRSTAEAAIYFNSITGRTEAGSESYRVTVADRCG